MPPILLVEGRTVEVPGAYVDSGSLWLPVDQLEAATGWHLEPEGLCRDERCVLLPGDDAIMDDEFVNLSAFASHLGQEVVHSKDESVWVIGAEPPPALGLALRQAPDFTLPDLQGTEYSLVQYRGRKVFLVTWASW
jgi:hypothetical protein